MHKKIPDVFVIVFALTILAAMATWFLPGGHYDREVLEVEGVSRTVVDEASFAFIESAPQHLHVFTAPILGFVRTAEIIIFIFLVGGAFFIFNETGAITAGIQRLVKALKGKEIIIIPLVMLFFSFFGAAFGMCEEAMPFVMIFVPLAISLGYDSLVGVSLTFVAAGVGFAGAFINPFTLQIAQGLAGVPLVSGWEYRILVWGLATALAIIWVMIYATRIKKDPKKSIMYDLDKGWRTRIEASEAKIERFTWRHGACIALLFGAIVGMIVGVTVLDWYMKEIAGLFFAMGIIAGFVGGLGPNQIAKTFVMGAKDIIGAALIVGFAGGIIEILERGQVMDTILYGMASATSSLPELLSAYVMYGVQMVLNFFIPSGSTKAALTMPIMAPLADLAGITRQTAVLAYQFGDGFTNLIIPTSGVTVGTLAMAKIPFEKWFRWHLPQQLAFIALALALLVWPVLTAWQ